MCVNSPTRLMDGFMICSLVLGGLFKIPEILIAGFAKPALYLISPGSSLLSSTQTY